jgi:release factor glutamine methyltransferase
MIRVAGVLAALRGRLGAASPTPALDAEILVAHVLGASRSAIASEPERPLAPEEMLALESLVRRKLEGEPVAYLMGRREFWSLELEVTPDVLVPRPETELVVERALAAIASRERPSVLDLGTGSGAIASAIARERPDADVTATDVSAAALAVAARNAARLALPNLRLPPAIRRSPRLPTSRRAPWWVARRASTRSPPSPRPRANTSNRAARLSSSMARHRAPRCARCSNPRASSA